MSRVPSCARIRLVTALGMAMVAAGCGSSQTATRHQTTPAGSTPAGPVARACTGAQLHPTYAGSNGATGHIELTIALRNVSSRPCRVSGYPDTRLLGAGGAAITFHVGHGHGFFPDTLGRPRRMLVAPGHAVHYGIGLVTNSEYAGAHVCRTITGALSALPGGAGGWRRVSLRRAPRLAPCGDRITVSAIHA